MLKQRQQAIQAQARQNQNVILDMAVDLPGISRESGENKYGNSGGNIYGSVNNGDFMRNVKILVALLLVCACVFYLTGFRLGSKRHQDKHGSLMQEVSSTDIKNESQCSETLYDINHLNEQKRLLYNALPKAGSMGLKEIFATLKTSLNFTSRDSKIAGYTHTRFHYDKETLPEIISDNDLVGDLNVVHQNFHFIDYSWFGLDNPYYINVIRDPVDHYVSWYYHRRFMDNGVNLHPLDHKEEDNKDKALWEKRKKMTFDDCVKNEDDECLKSEYTFKMIPFFCGQDEFCLIPSVQALEQAKRNVIRYFPVVGYVENMHEFLELCEVFWPQFLTGAADLHKTSFNSNINTKRIEPSKEVIEIMKGRLKLEYEFYSWVKQRFYCMYKEYVLRKPSAHHREEDVDKILSDQEKQADKKQDEQEDENEKEAVEQPKEGEQEGEVEEHEVEEHEVEEHEVEEQEVEEQEVVEQEVEQPQEADDTDEDSDEEEVVEEEDHRKEET